MRVAHTVYFRDDAIPWMLLGVFQHQTDIVMRFGKQMPTALLGRRGWLLAHTFPREKRAVAYPPKNDVISELSAESAGELVVYDFSHMR